MKNPSDERITDTVIGEAVMQLLDTGAEISWSTLTQTLQYQLKQEQDSERVIALSHAITDIQDQLRACFFSDQPLDYPSAQRQLH